MASTSDAIVNDEISDEVFTIFLDTGVVHEDDLTASVDAGVSVLFESVCETAAALAVVAQAVKYVSEVLGVLECSVAHAHVYLDTCENW